MPMLTAKKKQVPADIGIKRINSGSAYEPQIGYCRGVVADGWVLISGTTGNDHATMTTPEKVTDQCKLALGHISTALKNVGASMADVVRVNYILPDRNDFSLASQCCAPHLVKTHQPQP